jgi:UDP-N-acetylmuramoylalanine--D-glutamate ligase
VAVLLNVTPDHLDRHGDMEGYLAAKMHIFDRQTKDDVAAVAVDDAYTQSVARTLISRRGVRVIPASVKETVKRGVYVDAQGVLHDVTEGRESFTFDLKREAPRLPGKHNWQNAAVSYIAARACGVAPEAIAEGLRSFKGLVHRMEWVAEIDGVTFINDSKATNAEATANALEPYENIYWILGGKPKEGGIESLGAYFPRIAHAFLMGQAAQEFARTLEGKAPYTQCGELKHAFEEASLMALREKKPGAVVLLSPACASWDQWKNFEERGDAFCEMVRKLVDRA